MRILFSRYDYIVYIYTVLDMIETSGYSSNPPALVIIPDERVCIRYTG
jgi:transcriptional regulator of nitric oxide reductase